MNVHEGDRSSWPIPDGLYGEGSDGYRDIILTFDDGPRVSTTQPLLDSLARRQISAMFFVVGEHLETNAGAAALVRRAHEEGHIIGNHTYSHPNLGKCDRDTIRSQLHRTHDLVAELCMGTEPRYFRPPYGIGSSAVDDVLRERGYTSVLWNVDTEDWRRKQNGEWIQHGMQQIMSRVDSIVLMHDIYQTTVTFIDAFIDEIQDNVEGYRFSTY